MINYFKELIGKINFGRNTTPKIVSILFSIVLYIFVMGEINPEESVKLDNVPVQLLNVNELEREGLILIDQKDFVVEVNLSGTRNDLSIISPDDINVTADLRGFKEGISSIPLDVGEISNVEVKVSPMQIKVRLDEIVQRKKDVVIISKGKPSQDFIASSVTANPSEVIVEGSKTKVETIDKIIGEIDITDMKLDLNKDVAIKPIDSEGNDVIGVDLKTSKVNVDLVIDRIKNVIIEVPVVGSVKRGYKLVNVEAIPKKVAIKGKEDLIEPIKSVQTEPINIESLSKTVTIPVNLNLPEGVAPVYLTDPVNIKIEVEKIETKEFNYKARQILINNLDKELTTDISSNDSDIKVIISDGRSVLNKIKWSDLQLVIDANQLPEGAYDLKPRLPNEKDYIKVDIVPTSISVVVVSKASVAETISNNEGSAVEDGLIDIGKVDGVEETNTNTDTELDDESSDDTDKENTVKEDDKEEEDDTKNLDKEKNEADISLINKKSIDEQLREN